MASTSLSEKVGPLTSNITACHFPINRFPRGMYKKRQQNERRERERSRGVGWSRIPAKKKSHSQSHQQYGPAFAQGGLAAIKAAASSPVRLLPLRNRGVSIPAGASKIPSTWWSV